MKIWRVKKRGDFTYSWEQVIEIIRTMPTTWLPAALLYLVEEAVRRKVFKPGGLQTIIDDKLKKMEEVKEYGE
jgi:hypothetical protein